MPRKIHVRAAHHPLSLLAGFGFAAARRGRARPPHRLPRPAREASVVQAVAAKPEIVFKPIPKSGKKYDIDADTYLVYEFNEKPKMGTAFLKIQVFNKKGDKITPFVDHGQVRHALDEGSPRFGRGRVQAEQEGRLSSSGQRGHARRLGSPGDVPQGRQARLLRKHHLRCLTCAPPRPGEIGPRGPRPPSPSSSSWPSLRSSPPSAATSTTPTAT